MNYTIRRYELFIENMGQSIGRKKIEDPTLVAFTIMIAESRLEMMISDIMNCMQ